MDNLPELDFSDLPDLDFGDTSSSQKKQDYIKMRDQSFAKAHPVMTGIEKGANFLNTPLIKTLSGKSLTERSQEVPLSGDPSSIPNLIGQFAGGLTRDAAATGIDMATSPIALLGLAGKGIGMISKPLKNIAKYSNPKVQMDIADSFKNDVIQSKTNLVNSFGPEYEKIIGQSDKTVNVGNSVKNWIEDHGDQLMQNQEFSKALGAKDPQATKLYNMVDRLTKNQNIMDGEFSAKDADQLQKFIKNLPGLKGKISQGYKGGYVDMTNSERVMLDLANNIKSDVIDAHPDLATLNKNYGQTMDKIRDLRKLGSRDNLLKNLQNYHSFGPFTKESIDTLVSKPTINKIKESNNASQLYQILKKAGLGLAGSGVVGEGAKIGLTHHL